MKFSLKALENVYFPFKTQVNPTGLRRELSRLINRVFGEKFKHDNQFEFPCFLSKVLPKNLCNIPFPTYVFDLRPFTAIFIEHLLRIS